MAHDDIQDERDALQDPNVSATIVVPPVTEPVLDSEPLPPNPQTSTKERRIAFAILMLSIVCLGLGQTILFAVLPPLARDIGLADIQVGVIFTISAIAWVFLSPVWGRKSDDWGRKPVILLGVGAFCLSTTLLAVTMDLAARGIIGVIFAFIGMVMFRAIHGLMASAGPAAAQAYVADRTVPEERTASLANLTAAFGLGASIGPGIGSATAHLGHMVPLYVVGLIAALSTLTIFIFLPERSKPAKRKNKRPLKITDKRLRKVLVYGTGGGTLMVVPIQLIGFYLIDVLSLDEQQASEYLGIALMLSSLASLFAQLVIVQRLKISPFTLLVAAPLIAMLGHFIIVMGGGFGPIVFGLMLTGLGTGMIMPSYNAAISLTVEPDEQGAAAGIGNSAFAIGFIIAPILVFTLYDISPQFPFACTAVFACLLGVYAHLSIKPRSETN